MTIADLPRADTVGPLTETADATGGRAHLLPLRGRIELPVATATWRAMQERSAALTAGDRLMIDLHEVELIDGASLALLVRLRGDLAARGVTAEFTHAPASVQTLVHLYAGDAVSVPVARALRPGVLTRIGTSTLTAVDGARAALGFVGELTRHSLALIRAPRTGNWRDIAPTMVRAGVEAIPIVVLINFLVGFVVAYQAAAQLRQFGADVYVADLVGLSMTREMAPLMTAIIVCGRSGAAFTAELGSMRVSEEIDAVRTLGLEPIRTLVLPRVVALVLVVPVLTLIGDLVGIVGGFVVAHQSLRLSAAAYLTEMQKVVDTWDVASGVIKGAVFALAIALIACQQGFATTGGAQGVGRRTTAAVVSSLFAIIVIDAAFTMAFELYGL